MLIDKIQFNIKVIVKDRATARFFERKLKHDISLILLESNA